MATREERYRAKVIVNDEGCWDWTGTRSDFGYGLLFTGPRGASRGEAAHRISWEIHVGPIPNGLNVLHHCDNPPCTRPDHLFLGTQADNVRDRDRKGRQRSLHGEAVPNSKLTSDQVVRMRHRRAEGAKLRELEIEFGVTKGIISAICRRKLWKHVD